MDSEIIKDTRNGTVYKFIDGSLCYSKNGENYFINSKQSFLFEPEMYEIYKEPSWSDNLPVICWVWRDGEDEKFEAIINEYDDEEGYYSKECGEWFNNAQPWTEEDWEKYRAKK